MMSRRQSQRAAKAFTLDEQPDGDIRGGYATQK